MNEIMIELWRESIEDILKEMREYMDRASYLDCSKGDDDWEYLVGFLDRIEAAHNAQIAKLEADFAALLKDRNELAEKNRQCCEENERLREELGLEVKRLDAEDDE